MSTLLPLNVVVLAAGAGTRMKSALPKVLHCLAGKPLLKHVIDTAQLLKPTQLCVVYGHGGDQVRDLLAQTTVLWVEQAQQLGTGHAVAQAMPRLPDEAITLVLYGDVPLIKDQTLAELIRLASDGSLAVLTLHLQNPQGYGRIVRNVHGEVERIVEEKDASPAQKQITEINTGMLAVQNKKLRGWLSQLKNNNAQGEYYLTDIIALAVADGVTVRTSHPADESEVLGVNSRNQLAQLERSYQRACAEQYMQQGVTFLDPARVDFRGEVVFGRDVTVDVNVVFSGRVVVGNNVSIGANCSISDATLADGVEILPLCVIEQATVGANSRVGPYSRLRPGVILAGDNHIGNFVEIKNSQIGPGSKVNHLSYVGDTQMGGKVNIGAGTITANYDGANKHQTIIEDNASTGSNSVLVAPVTIGKGATIGAGSVITKTAPAGKLTLTRSKQVTIDGWQRPTKKL
jgi:bifunctional UDP-N-acetylglucosamine pyrophosphorylase/glucosamine-1-phosphate N-acetyltransferase